MIGQTTLLQTIDKLISYKFPPFTIISGPRGNGKKLVATYIANKLNYPIITIEPKIDNIREMINVAYTHTEPIFYLIPDADKMSIGAKNSLLKVIEEPPNNAYFLMTLQAIENTLPTIKSRCHELKMDLYTPEELNELITLINPNIDIESKNILINCCNNYGDIKLFNQYGVLNFYKYVEKVYANIYKVQSANVFKICEKLDIKGDDPNKYEIEIFLKTFRYLAYFNMLELFFEPGLEKQVCIINEMIKITSGCLQKLNITGISKQNLLDMWILDIRKVWRQFDENR